MRLFSNSKDMSINVNLSQEQIEMIANITADKVATTRNYYSSEVEQLRDENSRLRFELSQKEKFIVQTLITDTRYKDMYLATNKELIRIKEKYNEQ